MNPKVSVCIPTYNRKEYLRETLDSVFAQTYKDYEVIVVDDGSTDGTQEMLRGAAYPIRYYWQENSGDAAARNKMVELARGEFVTFIDSDDLLLYDSVDRMVEVMEAEDGDAIVYGPYLRIDQNGHVYGRCNRRLYSGHVTKYLFQDIFVHSGGSMFPRRVLEMSNGFDTSLAVCSDYDLWLRLSLKYRFVALAEPTFKRRRHRGNLSVRSVATCIKELNVLEDFYYRKGGAKLVPKGIAMTRLSKEAYRVGVCAIKEKNFAVANEYLSRSLRYHPNLKALVKLAFATVRRRRNQ